MYYLKVYNLKYFFELVSALQSIYCHRVAQHIDAKMPPSLDLAEYFFFHLSIILEI